MSNNVFELGLLNINIKFKNMKNLKFVAAIFLVCCINKALSQSNSTITVPPFNNASGYSSNSAPNGHVSHTTMRGIFNIPATQMALVSPSVILNSLGFDLVTGVSAPANGSLTLYIEHAASSTFTSSTTWTVATSAMTQVYSGNYNIKVTPTFHTVDFVLSTPFTYTGGAVNVAYEYIGTTFAPDFAYYSCFSNGMVSGAVAGSSSSTPPTNLVPATFRPLIRFGFPNNLTNEIEVSSVVAPGKFPLVLSAQRVGAQIKNNSNSTVYNVPLLLQVSGANTFSASQTVASLAAGASTIVSFASFTPVTMGINNLVVSCGPDQNNSNNTASLTQSITCNIGANNPFQGNYTLSVGFGTNGTGGGIISNKIVPLVNATLTALRLALSNDIASPGHIVYGVLLNNSGAIIAATESITIISSMLATFQTFSFAASQTLNSNTNYYVGMAQTPSTNSGYYPFGATTTSLLPRDYYISAINGGSLNPVSSNLGYFGFEPVYSDCFVSTVDLNDLQFTLVRQIYPNPSSDGKFVIEGVKGSVSISVFNTSGQLFQNFLTSETSAVVDLSQNPDGIYLIKIADEYGHQDMTKVIKNH
jgi:hypothetical protein